MSPQQHKGKNAKVEGRDPPEKSKETMETFRALAQRLLKVPMEEVRERQEIYAASRREVDAPKKLKNRKGRTAQTTLAPSSCQPPIKKSQQ